MQISETKEILRRVALIDNRKVSPETIEAWHSIIGSIPFEIAQEALKLAQQDATIKYLEPRHVYAWSKEAAFRLDRNKPVETPKGQVSPQPKCKHDRLLLECVACCRELKPLSDQSAESVLAFAKQNVLATR